MSSIAAALLTASAANAGAQQHGVPPQVQPAGKTLAPVTSIKPVFFGGLESPPARPLFAPMHPAFWVTDLPVSDLPPGAPEAGGDGSFTLGDLKVRRRDAGSATAWEGAGSGGATAREEPRAGTPATSGTKTNVQPAEARWPHAPPDAGGLDAASLPEARQDDGMQGSVMAVVPFAVSQFTQQLPAAIPGDAAARPGPHGWSSATIAENGREESSRKPVDLLDSGSSVLGTPLDVIPVPEPATWTLILLGGALLRRAGRP